MRTFESEKFLDGKVELYCGDCLAVMDAMEECSVDSVVCDPPYHLASIVERFGAENAAPAKEGLTGAYTRASAGFMGQTWDGGDIAFDPATWAKVYRVLKPGGYLLAFGAPRNFGFMQVAIAGAKFEIRDVVAWLFGTGFPKSHDVSKGIDKAAGAERTESVGVKPGHEGFANRGNMSSVQSFNGTLGGDGGFSRPWMDDPEQVEKYHQKFAPATDAARKWEGWGTALKPAFEPIIMARKPLSESTVAANVLEHGTGAINIDACRVQYESQSDMRLETRGVHCQTKDYDGLSEPGGAFGGLPAGRIIAAPDSGGRWPANVVHDGSDEVVRAFPDDRPGGRPVLSRGDSAPIWGSANHQDFDGYDDGGSAARFFYSAKADAGDRIGSKHPTVKPVDLMQWLVRMVTRPAGTVLDPFAGTGTTGEAAWREGIRAVLIEANPPYQADIRRRMSLAVASDTERQVESLKAAGKVKPVDDLPLFAREAA